MYHFQGHLDSFDNDKDVFKDKYFSGKIPKNIWEFSQKTGQTYRLISRNVQVKIGVWYMS